VFVFVLVALNNFPQFLNAGNKRLEVSLCIDGTLVHMIQQLFHTSNLAKQSWTLPAASNCDKKQTQKVKYINQHGIHTRVLFCHVVTHTHAVLSHSLLLNARNLLLFTNFI